MPAAYGGVGLVPGNPSVSDTGDLLLRNAYRRTDHLRRCHFCNRGRPGGALMWTVLDPRRGGRMMTVQQRERSSASGHTVAEVAANPEQGPRFGELMLAYAWIGAISIGGRSMTYVQDEFVRRRGWLSMESYLECFTLARVLPGSSGQNVAVLAGQALGGTRAAALCNVPYVLPGAL